MNAHCPFGPIETMTVLTASESSLGRFWCEMSFRFISIFIASFFLSILLFANFSQTVAQFCGAYLLFSGLLKKTGQDNSYMHLSGANFWHLIFRPNFKVVDIINDVFRDGRNTRISLLQIRWGQFWPNNSPLPLLQRLHFWSSLSPPEL